MAIQFVGRKIATKEGAVSGNTTISLSSGLTGGSRAAVAEGDLVIAVFSTGSTADRTLSITDGTTDYDLIGSELYANGISTDVNLRVAMKRMGSTPDGSVTFGPSLNAQDAACTAVAVFSGVDPTVPLDGVTVETATFTTPIANPPPITPSTAGAFIVCVGAGSISSFSFGNYSSSDLTGFFSSSANDTNCSILGIGHKDDWSSGSFDPAAFSYPSSASTYSAAAMSFVLRPDPAPPSSGGNIKVWNGSAWVAKPVKVWNGSAWVTKPVKRWNGSGWITTPY